MTACVVDADGEQGAQERIPAASFPEWARQRGPAARWVWGDTAAWYPALLAVGIRVDRCRDLRLAHAILRDSALVEEAPDLRAAVEWDAPMHGDAPAEATLFDLDEAARGVPEGLDAALVEFRRQEAVLATAPDGGRLRLLLAAESAGALVAAELRAAGVPWDARTHDAILTATLGERPAGGGPPAELQRAATAVEVWRAVQARASDPAAGAADESRARRAARDRGRFTRSFIVQGTAAEWALAWLADLRLRLAALGEVTTDAVPPASAGRLLFGDFPVDFPLDLRITETAEKD